MSDQNQMSELLEVHPVVLVDQAGHCHPMVAMDANPKSRLWSFQLCEDKDPKKVAYCLFRHIHGKGLEIISDHNTELEAHLAAIEYRKGRMN